MRLPQADLDLASDSLWGSVNDKRANGPPDVEDNGLGVDALDV
jgi:hypothetical protein